MGETIAVFTAQNGELVALSLVQRGIGADGGAEDGDELLGVRRHEGEVGEDAGVDDLGGLAQVGGVVPEGDVALLAEGGGEVEAVEREVGVEDAEGGGGEGGQVALDVGGQDGGVGAHVAAAEEQFALGVEDGVVGA